MIIYYVFGAIVFISLLFVAISFAAIVVTLLSGIIMLIADPRARQLVRERLQQGHAATSKSK